MNDQKLTAGAAMGWFAPKSWLGSLLPVVTSGAICVAAGGRFFPQILLLIWWSSVFAQAAYRAISAYHWDTRAAAEGASCTATPACGGTNPQYIYRLGLVLAACAAATGAWPAVRGGWVGIAIWVIVLAATLFYTAGKQPLLNKPIGELASAVMGAMLPLMVFAATEGAMDWNLVQFCLPFMLGAALVTMTNNLCDTERDAAVGRRTLTTQNGREKTVVLCRSLTVFLHVLTFAVLASNYSDGALLCGALLVCSFLSLRRFLRAGFTPEERELCVGTARRMNYWVCGAYLAGVVVYLLIQ